MDCFFYNVIFGKFDQAENSVKTFSCHMNISEIFFLEIGRYSGSNNKSNRILFDFYEILNTENQLINISNFNINRINLWKYWEKIL